MLSKDNPKYSEEFNSQQTHKDTDKTIWSRVANIIESSFDYVEHLSERKILRDYIMSRLDQQDVKIILNGAAIPANLLKLTPREFIKIVMLNFLSTFYYIFHLCLSAPRMFAKTGVLALCYFDPTNMDSDLKQAEILNQSRFTELKQVNARYMQNRNRKFAKQIDNTIITQDALLSAAKDYLSTKRKLSLACTMVINLLKLIIRSDSCGIACFRRLYLESPIAMELIKSGIRILVVCTQSNMQILPTPSYFTEVGTIMLWYSNNSIRIEKREKNPEPHLDFLGRDLVKIHYVWADSFARHLTDQASSLDVRVVGSIILNSLAAREQLDPTARIIVFDVTPFVGAGEDEYYNLENTSKFISDIVSSTQDLSRVIAIKPKRNYVVGNSKKSHDSKYVDLLISLQDQGKVQLLGPEADIYFEIGASSLVICIPLSSPALIAREMGVPVIYYNPDENSTWNLQNSYDGISLISGKKEIKSYLQTFN